MNESSGVRDSIWLRTAETPPVESLDQNLKADVCVVGGGIAGITAAFLLNRFGRSVVVLEDGQIGSGETGRTTAHLTNALDDRYFEIERLHGEGGARIALESHTRAIDLIETLVSSNDRIQCDFERLDGFLFLPPGGDRNLLEREFEAVTRAGLAGVQLLHRAPLSSFDTGPCLRFPRQAQFHPLKYLAGLVRAFESRGGKIFCGTHVVDAKDGTPARAETSDGFTVTAGAIIVATNTPVNNRFTIHTKQAAYRTYVVGLRVPKQSVARGLYWDTEDPYHYVRLQKESDTYDVLLVGGEDHKTGQADDTEERFARLETWARERFPMAGKIAYAWSGQVMEPFDALGFIGRNPGDENVYVITGDSGNGMTHGTIGGILVTDLILERDNPWSEVYDPSRTTLRAAKEFTRETANFVAQYKDLITPGEIEDPTELEPGSGAVMRRGMKKIAVYRDEEGLVHEFSAVCPHLGCVVAWNATEQTWDCPCHGSRFSSLGTVLNGPANQGLARVE